MDLSRRRMLAGSATALAFSGFATLVGAQDDPAPPPLTTERLRGFALNSEITGYGPLKPDPAGLFDLPEGFSYKVVSKAGDVMSDGLLTPHKADGMGAFAGPDGKVILVRNHELKPLDIDLGAFGPGRTLASKVAADRFYDLTDNGLPMTGGTTTLIWDTRSQTLETHYLSLAGTTTNCAGGRTPRGTWLSCEETTQAKGVEAQKDHGYVFEVPSTLRGIADPTPITAMGRFRHEATATDPRTGIVYMTEDMGDGFGLFYRYLPNDKDRLLSGGRLQALALPEGAQADPRNWDSRYWGPGDVRSVRWIDLDGVDNPLEDLRYRGHAAGAAWFARGEGIYFENGELYFACTSGGPQQLGQIYRYRPSEHEGQAGERNQPGRLTLFVEPTDPAALTMCDNIAVAPWGHLFVCEDKLEGVNALRAVTPGGKLYTIGRNAAQDPRSNIVNSELAGVCFSPDGSTLFVNIYWPGITLAITGLWGSLRT